MNTELQLEEAVKLLRDWVRDAAKSHLLAQSTAVTMDWETPEPSKLVLDTVGFLKKNDLVGDLRRQ